VFKHLLPLQVACDGSLFAFSQLLNQKVVLFNERRLIDSLVFSIFGPSFQFVAKAIRKQLAGLTNSLVLRLDLCSPQHTSYPVIACSLSWIDEGWTSRQYFVGLIASLSSSHWSQTPSSIAHILGAIGIDTSDCITLIATRSPLILPFASSLHIEYCIEDLFGCVTRIFRKAFEGDMGVLASASLPTLFLNGNGDSESTQSQSLVHSLRRANSLIEFLNTNFGFPLCEGLVNFSLELLEWENLLLISSSLSRYDQSMFVLISFSLFFSLGFFISTPSS
jgi:hypothetical protein